MTIKQSDHGIVVEHKESGSRFAISDRNYNPDVHRKVRDLKPGESVTTYVPKSPKESLGTENDPNTYESAAGDAAVGSGDAQ